MQRRSALKSIGLSLGAISMSSTLVALIQSCAQEKKLPWKPKFFSPEEVEIVSKTLETILPATPNIPGATDLNLTQFIDGYLHAISTEKEKAAFKSGIEQYLSTTLETTGKNDPRDLTETDIETRLAYYLKGDADQIKAWNVEVAVAEKDDSQLPSVDAINFIVLKSLRKRGIDAFIATEFIAENVLAYDPIPGSQKGCVDLQEITGGKVWSL